jgi:bisphosphoglycerate-independent phosphoglycerate mutase
MILDGWGCRAEAQDNAIAQASTPCWDQLWQKDPHALITTSGEAVGLPSGQMGNSEVGHMNIGAGRIVYQDYSRITRCILDGSFQKNEVIAKGLEQAISSAKTVHVMGLLSPGGVHSHEQHFQAAWNWPYLAKVSVHFSTRTSTASMTVAARQILWTALRRYWIRCAAVITQWIGINVGSAPCPCRHRATRRSTRCPRRWLLCLLPTIVEKVMSS